MRNGIALLIFAGFFGAAILIGGIRRSPDTHTESAAEPVSEPAPQDASPPAPEPQPAPPPAPVAEDGIPHIGRLRVLNGCGISKAANEIAEHLRTAGFDVKDVDNAPTWNYEHTIVVSRTRDTHNAEQVAEALTTERVVMMRTDDSLYDVVVFVGTDFRERMQ